MEHAGSYYAASATPSPPRPPLAGDETADVCIIGAGFSGLSTALHLCEKGYKVIILEAARVGFGASGRNGGQVINGYSRGYDTIKSRYGEDTARALLSMSFEGGHIIRSRIEKYGISCDYREGSFFAAFNDKQMQGLEHSRRIWEGAGHKGIRMYGKDDMHHIVSHTLYCGGMLDTWGGHIHPLNLCLGQAAAVEKLGGRIFEQSRVTHLEHGAKPVVRTAAGSVRADTAIVCGNAYLGDAVPELSMRYMPVSSQIITTEPLGADTASKLMPAGFCVEDSNFVMDYYRVTADSRLLFGGGIVYGGATPTDIAGRLAPRMAKTFPEIAKAKIDFAWSGNFALTLTRMPHVGRIAPNVYFSHGDSGHGVTTTHLLGKLLAEAVDGQMSRFDTFAGMRNLPFPGGRLFRVPLTALGAWYYGLRDRLGL